MLKGGSTPFSHSLQPLSPENTHSHKIRSPPLDALVSNCISNDYLIPVSSSSEAVEQNSEHSRILPAKAWTEQLTAPARQWNLDSRRDVVDSDGQVSSISAGGPRCAERNIVITEVDVY